MKRALALLALTLLGLGWFGLGPAAAQTLKSTAVELPSGFVPFPGGDKADAINANCLACHSAEMVLMQPALPKAEWAKEVAKMRKAYGAPVQDKDVPAIVDYLAALKPGT